VPALFSANITVRERTIMNPGSKCLTRWVWDYDDSAEVARCQWRGRLLLPRMKGRKSDRWHHCLPVLDFAPQLHEKRQDFVGRQWLFDEIDAWRAGSSRERALLIVGDPGIGKSAFVAEMIQLWGV
jgi:hypothetical protein